MYSASEKQQKDILEIYVGQAVSNRRITRGRCAGPTFVPTADESTSFRRRMDASCKSLISRFFIALINVKTPK